MPRNKKGKDSDSRARLGSELRWGGGGETGGSDELQEGQVQTDSWAPNPPDWANIF